MELELCIFLAFVVGYILGIFFPHKSTGTLKIDHSNPEKDLYRFEIDDLDKLSSKKRIILSIDNKADLSQN